jgi:hypothetical protein
MSRQSRPPGFDMTYKPKKMSFGPPLLTRLPSTIYFGIVALVTLTVFAAPLMPRESWIYREVVIGDQSRVFSAGLCSLFLLASGLAAFMRQQMSGVVVFPDGLLFREIYGPGIPRMRRYAWSQIDRVAIPSSKPKPEAPKKIRVDLWDGTREWLPDVAKLTDLAVLIERVALARAIPVEGGTGLIDELGSPFEGEEEEAA